MVIHPPTPRGVITGPPVSSKYPPSFPPSAPRRREERARPGLGGTRSRPLRGSGREGLLNPHESRQDPPRGRFPPVTTAAVTGPSASALNTHLSKRGGNGTSPKEKDRTPGSPSGQKNKQRFPQQTAEKWQYYFFFLNKNVNKQVLLKSLLLWTNIWTRRLQGMGRERQISTNKACFIISVGWCNLHSLCSQDSGGTGLLHSRAQTKVFTSSNVFFGMQLPHSGPHLK